MKKPGPAIVRTALNVAKKLRNARAWTPNAISSADLHDIAALAVQMALDEDRWKTVE